MYLLNGGERVTIHRAESVRRLYRSGLCKVSPWTVEEGKGQEKKVSPLGRFRPI